MQSLTPTVAQTFVQAFIGYRLDYCNSLLYGIADSQLRRLQSVQNGAARLMTGMAAYGAHHTSSAVAALATGPATDFVQAGGIGSQVPQWACTCLPDR